jgi:hypothetical protein
MNPGANTSVAVEGRQGPELLDFSLRLVGMDFLSVRLLGRTLTVHTSLPDFLSQERWY